MKSSISISPPWTELPKLIEFLRNSRDINSDLIESFNITIILHSASIIEGVISQLLSNEIYIASSPSLSNRLIKYCVDRIEKSSWKELPHLYSVIFGSKISDKVGNEVWKGVNSLFTLRNLLTHSNPIEVTYSLEDNDKIKDFVISSKYKSIYNFLANEKSIVQKIDINNDNSELKLITDKSADYYWENTLTFLKIILVKEKTLSPVTRTLFDRVVEHSIIK